LILLFCFEPKGQAFYPICLFHSTTGLLCPGCGSLRALHQLLHGHLLAAFKCNALLLALLPGLGWYGFTKWRPPPWPGPEPSKWRVAMLWLLLALALLFTVLRNLPGPSFGWLRPG
jgi:hypothetical protein